MTVMQTVDEQLAAVMSEKELYTNYQARWKYLLESYLGGDDYREGANLTQYQLETQLDYNQRLQATSLDNHCNSVISVYNSFLFRHEPDRDFGSLENSVEVLDFLEDCDFDGRSLNNFMKEVATWASVFGHCWIVMAKPNIGAQTRAEEIAAGVRPYLSMASPLNVLDWSYERQRSGRYELIYLKYIEEMNDSLRTIKEWYPDRIVTTVTDIDKRTINYSNTESNGLGFIPAVCAYNQRTPIRGIGTSDIVDIADTQRMIYNINSEIEQSIRVDSHPSLVKTNETAAGIGAGSIIAMPENLDPGLKPYLLNYDGAEVSAMLEVKRNLVEVIDKMANTGAIRGTEARTMSGIALQTEFELLNARLAEKADNLELAEEQLWTIFAIYQGTTWTGHIEYPGSFNIRDTENEIAQLKMAKETATDVGVYKVIDYKLLEYLGIDNPAKYLTNEDGLPSAYVPANTAGVPAGENCANCEYFDAITNGCSKWDETVNPVYWCRAWEGRIEDAIEEASEES